MTFPKKEILMAYIMRLCDFLEGGISKKGNLMDYISRSVAHQNMMYAYDLGSSWQGESDGLCKQIM